MRGAHSATNKLICLAPEPTRLRKRSHFIVTSDELLTAYWLIKNRWNTNNVWISIGYSCSRVLILCMLDLWYGSSKRTKDITDVISSAFIAVKREKIISFCCGKEFHQVLYHISYIQHCSNVDPVWGVYMLTCKSLSFMWKSALTLNIKMSNISWLCPHHLLQ